MRTTSNPTLLPGLLAALWASQLGAADALAQKITMTASQLQAAGVTFASASAVEPDPADAASGLSVRLSGRVAVPNAALDAVLAPVEGRIEALLVDPGQDVRAGQPLVRIRSAQLLELQRDYITLRARAQLTSERAQRDQQLLDEGIIARNRLLESQSAATEAAAALRAQEQMLRLAGFSDGTLGRLKDAGDIAPTTTLATRRAGRVLQLSVTVGQSVAGGDPLLHVAALDQLWIELQATRAQAQGIRAGDAVVVTGCPEPGRVISSAAMLDAQSQTLALRASIPRAGNCMTPNQFVEAQVAPRATPGLVAVPDSSVVQHAGTSYVFLRTGEGLQPIAVTIERRANGTAWLAGKLAPGGQVARSGLAAIKGSWLGLGAATQEP